jgi:hypothetical protein
MNFLNPYSRTDYKKFFQDSLLTDSFRIIEEEISLEFKPQFINKAELVGRDKSLELEVYEIEHSSENDPRVGLSKDFFRLMANYGSKRALAIFHSAKSKNYRLSLATVDLSLEGSRVKREYSNPRRYSFFLGPDAKIHTPSEFLLKRGRVSDFDDLQERFSVEVVNKEFYQRIAIQFSRLTGGKRKIGNRTEDFRRTLSLPSVTQQNIFQEFAVRLIGRLVFCWFLKMKKSSNGKPLISDKVLSLESVKLKNNYYHDVLEKLFFEVLNTPIDERGKEFKQEPYLSIPFLNGGLFNPHSYDFFDVDRAGVSKYLNTLKVPDKWLQEFIEILETYNFTVDENTSVDIDLSVDPEMLGRIFENLLAEINPETGESARKATGSYYTPRTIVEYMVDEGLKQYLINETAINENRISNLLSYSDGEIDISDKEKEKIVDAFDKVKILDPACGSGAFPIGVLQKMLLVLKRVDPNSQMWLNKQLDRVPTSALRNELKKKLEDENVEYIHKLGIIQNSIYGVDIQPIAADISKLRCFLSLIVEEKIYDDRANRGILPLPNLEFKFVAANTLIPLPKSSSQSELFNVDEEIQKLEELRKQYFTASGKQKDYIEAEFLKTQKELVANYFRKQAKDDRFVKLANWDPFSDDNSNWFDPVWMFGLNVGFDIVIGNPPYVRVQNLSYEDIDTYKLLYKTAFKRIDISILFIEKSIELLKSGSFCIFITSSQFVKTEYGEKIRAFLPRHLSFITYFGDNQIFEGAINYISIFGLIKNDSNQNVIFSDLQRFSFNKSIHSHLLNVSNLIPRKNFTKDIWYLESLEKFEIIKRIKSLYKKSLSDYSDVEYGLVTGSDKYFVLDSDSHLKKSKLVFPLLKPSNTFRYLLTVPKHYIIYPYKNVNGQSILISEIELKNTSPQVYKYLLNNKANLSKRKDSRMDVKEKNNSWYALMRFSSFERVKKVKILTQALCKTNMFCIDYNGYFFTGGSIYSISSTNPALSNEALLGLLNSKWAEFYYQLSCPIRQNGYRYYAGNFLKTLPISDNIISLAPLLDEYVRHILKSVSNSQAAKFNEIENKINLMVYKAYKLNFKEVKIIDPAFALTEREYDNFKIE